MLEKTVLFLENFIREVLELFNEQEVREEKHSNQCAELLLRDALHPDLFFYLHGEKPIKNLIELSEELNNMSEKTFVYHVREEKNDFAEWVNNVVGDSILAEKMFKAKTLPRLRNTVNVRVEWLKSKAGLE